MREKEGPVDFSTFHNVSRDPSICFNTSISGMTVEIDPDHPEMLTCAWITLPARTVAFPVFMGQSSVPECLANGTINRQGKASPKDPSRWEEIERSLHAEKDQFKADLANSIDAGNPHPSHVELVDQWCQAQTARILNELASVSE